MDERTGGRTNEEIDELTVGRTDERTDEQSNGQTDEMTCGQTDASKADRTNPKKIYFNLLIRSSVKGSAITMMIVHIRCVKSSFIDI